MRDERDCMNCDKYRYSYKNHVPICELGKNIVEWDGEFDWDSEEDDNFGAYLVNEKGERIECEDFRERLRNKRGCSWRNDLNITKEVKK